MSKKTSEFNNPRYVGQLCGRFFLEGELPSKGTNIQFRGTDVSFVSEKINILMSETKQWSVNDPRPFIQGKDKDWIMVEFWISDLDKIMTFIDILVDRINIDIPDFKLESY